MRSKIRGLRTIEKTILVELDRPSQEAEALSRQQRSYAAQIVLDYCAAVRGILNDNHGGPLTPPGWRMAKALEAICQSLERNLEQPPTPISSKLRTLYDCLQRGLSIYNQDKAQIGDYVKDLKRVFETLNPENGLLAQRQAQFQQFMTEFAQEVTSRLLTCLIVESHCISRMRNLPSFSFYFLLFQRELLDKFLFFFAR